jgi:outer membrane protein
MKVSLFSIYTFLSVMFFYSMSFALEGMEELSKNLFEKNQEVMSLQKNIESKEAIGSAANSNYYPTLNAVVGYGQNKTDDLPTIQKGQIGYLEGKFNIYKGHKDQAVKNQKDIDVQIAKLELESKKRELRLEMTDIASQMVFLHKLQSILDEELKTTQTQKQMASKKVAAGLTSTVDNLEFQLRENEIQIEQKQIDQQHEEAHQRFMKLYGEDIADTGIGRLDFSDITLIEKIVKTTTPLKIEDTVDYQKAKLSEDHLDLEKKEIKSEFLPSVDFTYSVGRLTPSEDTSVKYNENKYALQVTVPLFSGYDTYYKTKAAALSLQAAERSKNQKKNDLISDFNTVKIKISELIQLFQINEIKLFTSQSYFDMTLSEYRRGVKNSPDLVSATERLFSTKKKKLEILKELEILKVKFENYYLAPLT